MVKGHHSHVSPTHFEYKLVRRIDSCINHFPNNSIDLYINSENVGSFYLDIDNNSTTFVSTQAIILKGNVFTSMPLDYEICRKVLGPTHFYINEFETNRTTDNCVRSLFQLFIYTLMFLHWKFGILE